MSVWTTILQILARGRITPSRSKPGTIPLRVEAPRSQALGTRRFMAVKPGSMIQWVASPRKPEQQRQTTAPGKSAQRVTLREGEEVTPPQATLLSPVPHFKMPDPTGKIPVQHEGRRKEQSPTKEDV